MGRRPTRFKWLGFCLECNKWRNNHHVLTNVVSGQRRCALCGAVILSICPVCDGDGRTEEGRHCDHCGGHRVVPQAIVAEKESR